jgi:hypothetical protein
MALGRARPRAPVMVGAGLASHSYQGQDRFVLEVLGGLRGGFFLDSGASDGVSGSNTLLLESAFGWQGICVEPNERLFARLARARRCACVNCCLYDEVGEVAFLEGAGVFGGILDAYDPTLLRYARSVVASQAAGIDGGGVVTKRARTVRSVLRELRAPRVIDYWSLDTEGSELAILRSFPFDKRVVRVLTVEHNLTPVREEIRRFLEARGYRRARVLGIDDGYVLEGPRPGGAWRSRAWSRASPPAEFAPAFRGGASARASHTCARTCEPDRLGSCVWPMGVGRWAACGRGQDGFRAGATLGLASPPLSTGLVRSRVSSRSPR